MGSQDEDPDLAGRDRSDWTDNASTASTSPPAGRGAWLKNPAIVVALITVAGGVLVALINNGFSADPDQPADAISTSSPSVVSSSTSSGKTTSSSPEQGDSSEPGRAQSDKWVVEDEALSVSASYEPSIFPYGGSTFLMPAEGVAPASWPNHLGDPEGYARDHDGRPAGVAAVQLVLRANSDEPVVITSVVPRVVDRLLTPSAGYAVKTHYGCGGIPIRSVWADFDAEPVKVQYDEGTGGGLIDRMALKLTLDDPEVVVVNGIAKTETVAWDVLIRYDSSAGTGELVVDHDAEPFVTTDVEEGTPVWDYDPRTALSKNSSGDPYGYC